MRLVFTWLWAEHYQGKQWLISQPVSVENGNKFGYFSTAYTPSQVPYLTFLVEMRQCCIYSNWLELLHITHAYTLEQLHAYSHYY